MLRIRFIIERRVGGFQVNAKAPRTQHRCVVKLDTTNQQKKHPPMKSIDLIPDAKQASRQ
jgi:hypothetical protein